MEPLIFYYISNVFENRVDPNPPGTNAFVHDKVLLVLH